MANKADLIDRVLMNGPVLNSLQGLSAAFPSGFAGSRETRGSPTTELRKPAERVPRDSIAGESGLMDGAIKLGQRRKSREVERGEFQRLGA